MAGEWHKSPFEQLLIEPVRNGIYKTKDFHGRGAKIVNMGELFAYPRLHAVPMKRVELSDSESGRFLLAEGDLIFARRSLTAEGAGKCSVVLELDEATTFESSIIRARPNTEKTDSLYLYYFFNSPSGFHLLDTIRRQVAVAGITGGDLAKLEIPIPPLPDQRAIAHILGKLDDKIELNRRGNQSLEAMARALFKDWFVDFGPVRAKMEGREPYLPADLWQLFPDRLDDEGKPEGWEVVPASKLIEFNPTEPLPKGTPAPYLDMASLPTSGSWSEPPIMRDFGSGMRFRNGDTLLARITPCLENGKTAFVQCLPDDTVGWGSTEYIVMRPKAPVPAGYAYLLARDDAFREHAIRSMTGTSGRQRAQGDSVATFKLASPPDEDLWHAFASQVAPIFESVKSNAQANETLAQLRDILLPKLVSGDLRIANAEKFLEKSL